MRRIYVVWIICWTILNGFRNSWVFNIYLGFRNTSTACWSGKQTIGKGCLSRISPTQITAIGTLTFWDDHLVPPVLSEMTITVIGTFCYATTKSWEHYPVTVSRHLLLRQGAESCIFLSFHGNDEAPFWETWLPSLFEESKIAMGHRETLNHAACSSSNPDPQLLHGFKRHAGSTLLRALFVLTNLDITQKMKRLLAVKYVTSDKWCNLCFATTNGILTCQHGLVLDLSGILVTSSPPPAKSFAAQSSGRHLGKTSRQTLRQRWIWMNKISPLLSLL